MDLKFVGQQVGLTAHEIRAVKKELGEVYGISQWNRKSEARISVHA
jgi:hypothetical protein